MREAWHVVEPSTPIVWGWHLDAIVMHLEAVTRGEIQNLIITIPPGSTKSITVSVIWPAWVWLQQPGLRFLCGSNVGDLSIRDAVACRRLIESEWYQSRWGKIVKLATDQNVKSWYENTSRGFRTTVTTGTTVTGRKGDILLLDDPNDAQKVEGEAERRHVNNWWDKAFYNRVNHHKTGRRVVIGQRLHHDDLIGHIIKTSSDFVELRIPEEFDAKRRTVTPIWSDPRTFDGELLRPNRFGPKEVAEARRRLGIYGYAAQHRQAPELVEGGRFKSPWFRYYTMTGEIMRIGDSYIDRRELVKFITVDPAASESSASDFTVISTWAWHRGDLIWLSCKRFRAEIPEIVPHIQQEVLRWRPTQVAIETALSNVAVYQLACRAVNPVIPAVPVSPLGRDKLVRATPAIALASTGRLYLPSADPDFPRSEVERELTRFTGTDADDHDDIVDSLSYAVESESSLPTLSNEGPQGYL